MLSGDTNPIRDIGHARWRDLYAKLENPVSKEFKEAVAYEQARWHQPPEAVEWSHTFESVYKQGFPESPEYAQESYSWQKTIVYIQHALGHTLNVWIGDDIKYKGIKNFGTDENSNHYFVVKDVGSGGEDLEIAVYTYGGESKPVYRFEHVGERACFAYNKLWYQVAENRLRTPGVAHTDLKSGADSHIIYFDYDPRFQVEIYQSAYDDTVYVKRYNALTQQIGQIVRNAEDFTIEWITPANESSGSLFPISPKMYGSNHHLHVLEKSPVKLPTYQYMMDAFVYKSKIYISTIHACVMNIYAYNPKTLAFQKLTHYNTPCTLVFHNSPNTPPRFAYHSPNIPTQIYELNTAGGDLHTLIQIFPEILSIPHFVHGTAKVKDADIPYWYVSHIPNPTRVLVSAYGAYGITAHAGYPLRWLPYLERGYALVVAAPRGGRDKGDEWYDGGRTAVRKQTTFDDTAAVIKAVQERFHFKPNQIIIYGRSAGGWLAAYIGLKYPHLVGAVYAEVPYLDVLRTTTNPALPLTQLEYDEFGDPIRRPDEFKALKLISPNNIVRRAPSRAPCFLVRTALHDAQVLPYEALKFAKHLRKNGWCVTIGLDMNGGHFTKPSSSAEIQGADAAILDQALSASAAVASRTTARSRTRRARVHGSNGVTRRRLRSSRKHAIVH
jgi:protease II